MEPEDKPAKRPPGRPIGHHTKHKPVTAWNKETASWVEALSGRGRTLEEVSKYLKIPRRELRQIYRIELEVGGIKMIAKLENTAHELANGREAKYDPVTGNLIQSEIKPQALMVRFLLMTKAGYRMPAILPDSEGEAALAQAAAEGKKVVITVEGGLPPRNTKAPAPPQQQTGEE